MSQPRSHSVIEAIVNTAAGLGLSILAQYIIYPFYDIEVTIISMLEISIIFTVISLLRSYVLRRIFNKFHR